MHSHGTKGVLRAKQLCPASPRTCGPQLRFSRLEADEMPLALHLSIGLDALAAGAGLERGMQRRLLVLQEALVHECGRLYQR